MPSRTHLRLPRAINNSTQKTCPRIMHRTSDRHPSHVGARCSPGKNREIYSDFTPVIGRSYGTLTGSSNKYISNAKGSTKKKHTVLSKQISPVYRWFGGNVTMNEHGMPKKNQRKHIKPLYYLTTVKLREKCKKTVPRVVGVVSKSFSCSSR